MISMPGPMELVIIGIIMVLLFGTRLPKIARSLGSSIVEFKRGVKGVEDEVDDVRRAVTEPLKEEKR